MKEIMLLNEVLEMIRDTRKDWMEALSRLPNKQQ